MATSAGGISKGGNRNWQSFSAAYRAVSAIVVSFTVSNIGKYKYYIMDFHIVREKLVEFIIAHAYTFILII